MGRDKKNEARVEHFAKMVRSTMEEPAWKALSTTAQALYPWLKLEWHGTTRNNNGRISLSVRQAAERLGVGINTAAKGFHDLQAKGFIVVTKSAHLGVRGHGSSPEYELTELAPNAAQNRPNKLYKQWRPGEDFPVQKGTVNNPSGRNSRWKKVLSFSRARENRFAEGQK
jgi:DNA-binding transcriptional MocR family regulator